MSRAFVKEPDGGAPPEPLPDRPISPHPNIVTPEGSKLIDSHLDKLREQLTAARDKEDRAALEQLARDLRYWSARRATAQVVNSPEKPSHVAFGVTVTLDRHHGKRQIFRIVGEDEADPARGTLSYVAPLARALIGRRVGDVVSAGNAKAEIVEIN